MAFIIFTEAINQFPLKQFWAVLFFLMLFTLGVDSQFGTLEGVATSLVDMKLFPKANKEVITGVRTRLLLQIDTYLNMGAYSTNCLHQGLCLSCGIISMVFANGAGSYIFQLMDSFAGVRHCSCINFSLFLIPMTSHSQNYTLLIIAFFECISVSYIYGIKRFADDIELMTGKRPALYWMICWKYVSPIAMIIILTASFIDLALKGSRYPVWDAALGRTVEKEWPHWCIFAAILLVCVSILWIPGVAICRLLGNSYTYFLCPF